MPMKDVLERTRRQAVAFNMTPMIDVVFLLIIFFLVSSQLVQREQRLTVALPVASTGQQDRSSDSVRMTITVQPDGRIWQAGEWLSSDEFAQRLQQRRDQLGDQLELRIRCDRNTAYRHVGPILTQAARLQVWRVAFAVTAAAEFGERLETKR